MGNTGSACVCSDAGLTAPVAAATVSEPAAPDFEMISIEDDSKIKLRTFLRENGCHPGGNKPSVLQFYASWCGSSHKQADALEQLSRAHGRKANFVHINVDSDRRAGSNARTFHQDHNIGRYGSHHFCLDRENDRLSAQLYSISYLPTRVIIGKDGSVAVADSRCERPAFAPSLPRVPSQPICFHNAWQEAFFLCQHS